MGKVLCVCAHQDDDAFVVSRLRKHKFSGDEIRVVFTTLSLQNGDEYKKRRMNEARKAAELLGTARVDFLGFPDGQSYKYIRQIVLSLRDLISEYKPGIIYVNAFEGGHIDHDTANFCIAKAVQDKAISIFEFLLYNGYKRGLLPFRLRSFLPETSVQVTKLSDEEYSFVKDYWRCYPSQFCRFLMYVHLFSDFKKVFGYEYIRELPDHDYLNPSVTGVAYEKYLGTRFSDFRSSVIDADL